MPDTKDGRRNRRAADYNPTKSDYALTEAAAELWSQIFERAAARPDSALYDDSADQELADNERRRQAMKSAGWTDKEIEVFARAHEETLRTDAPTSPGVAPWLEGQLHAIATPIKEAMYERGYRDQKKVLLGIDPTAGVSASMTNVMMTDEGIVSVSAFLFRWCGLVARAYLRTLHLDVHAWSDGAGDPDADLVRLYAWPDLVAYWQRIFFSFAATGTHNKVPYLPSTRREVWHFEQIAWAMEFFVVGHEFGHHALGHRTVGEDQHLQEFQADSFSLYISEMLHRQPFRHLDNPYVRTGAGAHIMLRSLKCLAIAEAAMGKPHPSRDTHPPVTARVDKIVARHALQPARHAMDLHWNATVARIMNTVDACLSEFIAGLDIDRA